MSMFRKVRGRINNFKAERKDLDAIYKKSLKEEKEKYAKEKAVMQVEAMRQKGKDDARAGGKARGLLKRAGKEYKQYRKEQGLGKTSIMKKDDGPKRVWTGTGYETVHPKKKSSSNKGKTITIRL